jgi:hypothetical protein
VLVEVDRPMVMVSTEINNYKAQGQNRSSSVGVGIGKNGLNGDENGKRPQSPYLVEFDI